MSTAYIDKAINFLTAWQDGMWMSQCFECGDYAKLDTRLSVKLWHLYHPTVCLGDDGLDDPPKDISP